MIAITLGSLVTLTILTFYISTSRNYAQDERYAFMQENGRYALRALADDIAMADFWGQVVSTDTIGTSVTLNAGDSCGASISLFNATASMLYNNRHSSGHSQFTPCSTVTDNIYGNTDVFALKRVEGRATATTFVDAEDVDGDGNLTEVLSAGNSDLESNAVYLRTNGTAGEFLINAQSSTRTAGEGDWRYHPRIYFVRDFLDSSSDGIPALCRMTLNGSLLSEVQCLAEGVEDFHLQFGIDQDVDGVANIYTSVPSTDDMKDVVSVRIYLLMRSSTPTPHYVNNKTYQLGDVSIPAANDGFIRRVYTSTVIVRNTLGRRQFL